jgi:hypothetical protein
MAEMTLQAAFDAVADEIDELAAQVVGGQQWLPAVANQAALPSAYGTPTEFVRTKNYLCKVLDTNDDYQCIARESGDPVWTLFSDHTDYVDEEELENDAAGIIKVNWR